MTNQKISALTQDVSVAGTELTVCNDAGTTKSATIDNICQYVFKMINGSSGAAGDYCTCQNLTSNSSDVTSTGLSAAVMSVTGVGAGTWKFTYFLAYQSAATTNGIGFGINHTGTATTPGMIWYHATDATTTATGNGDDSTTTTAGQMLEGKSGSTLNAVIGSVSAGVTVANTNIAAVLEGILVVTVSGTLELKIASEVGGAGNEVRIMKNSCLKLCKIG